MRDVFNCRKKESTAEKLHDVRGSLSLTEEEVGERRRQVESFAGETILKGDDFKRYVNSLRSKSTTYKQKRAELSDLKVIKLIGIESIDRSWLFIGLFFVFVNMHEIVVDRRKHQHWVFRSFFLFWPKEVFTVLYLTATP